MQIGFDVKINAVQVANGNYVKTSLILHCSHLDHNIKEEDTHTHGSIVEHSTDIQLNKAMLYTKMCLASLLCVPRC